MGVPVVSTARGVMDTIQTTSDHLGMALPGEVQLNSLTTTLLRHQEALRNGSLSWEQALLPSQDFTLPFSLSQGGTDSQDGERPSSFNALLSGNIKFSRFEDSSPLGLISNSFTNFTTHSSSYGSATAYVFGLDMLPNPQVPLVTGLQLAFTRCHSEAEAGVDDRLTEIEYDLDIDQRLFTIHPYLVWDATEHLTLWASLGYGLVESEFWASLGYGPVESEFTQQAQLDNEPNEPGDFLTHSTTTNGDLFSAAVGANVQIWQSGRSALHLKVDGGTTTFSQGDNSAGDNPTFLDEVTTKRGRLAAQLSRDFTLNSARLRSSAELALLLLSDNTDDTDDVSAAELSGSLNWLPHQGRLSGTTTAWILLFGDDLPNYNEWGIGGSLLLLPGERGEGLSLSLQPSLGQGDTNTLQFFEEGAFPTDPADLELGTSLLTARFQAEVAYGFRRHHALLTPYGQLNLTDTSTTTSAGLRSALDDSLDLDLSASHRQHSSGANENLVFLQLRSDL